MYEAIVTQLKDITAIKGADRIVSAQVNNGSVNIATVIVGIDSKENDIGIYFPPDVQLSEEYCNANDLLARYDETGTKIGGGYFDHKRRVRAQKFKGIRSDGLWMPLSSLDYLFTQPSIKGWLALGKNFTHIENQEICRKYFNEKTLQVKNSKTPKRETKVLFFPEHTDTAQLIHEIKNIPEGSTLTLTEKLHGTSHRIGHVPVTLKLKWYQRLINWIAKDVYPKVGYEIVHGTRRVILEDPKRIGYHGSEEFRFKAVGNIDIPPGMIIYGEIVGYANGNPIMNPHNTKELREIVKEFGTVMIYDYGCKPDECKFFVYRITMDGKDLCWQDVQNWARTLGFSTPFEFNISVYNGNEEELLASVKYYAEHYEGWVKSEHGNHISEGVVLRVDYNNQTAFYKYKSWAFKVMEGIIRSDPDIVDLEEVS